MFVIVLSVVTTNMISLYSGSISALNLCKKPISVKKMNLAMGGVSILFSRFLLLWPVSLDFFYTFYGFPGFGVPTVDCSADYRLFISFVRKYVHSEISNETGIVLV